MEKANKLELVPATLADYPTLQNMGRFYVYDMSEYMAGEDWAIPSNGLFECIDFRKYWDDVNAYPFIIQVDGEIAGFVIIDKKGSSLDIEFNMAQFFILRRFKSKGIGSQVGFQCFDRFRGVWEVKVMLQNDGAYHFWKSVISNYSKNQFQEEIVNLKPNDPRIVFRFSS